MLDYTLSGWDVKGAAYYDVDRKGNLWLDLNGDVEVTARYEPLVINCKEPGQRRGKGSGRGFSSKTPLSRGGERHPKPFPQQSEIDPQEF